MDRKLILPFVVVPAVLLVFLFSSMVVASNQKTINPAEQKQPEFTSSPTPFPHSNMDSVAMLGPSSLPSKLPSSSLILVITKTIPIIIYTPTPRVTRTRTPLPIRTRTTVHPDTRMVTRTNTVTRTLTPTIPSPTTNPNQIPAFPEAQGFGSETIGGRGGRVIEVTNLNDSGAGSLRNAITSTGARIVVFRVAGTIKLNSPLRISNPYITIAGQSAPGGGITLRGMTAATDPIIAITAHDVVVRYLTLRAGPPSAGDALAIQTEDHKTYNIVIDHISASWAVGRNLMTWYDVHDITVQWSILSEGLNCSINPKGCHSKGALLGGYASDESKKSPGAYDFSFHHNLLAHNQERNPLVTMSGVCDVVNNVAYNPGNAYGQVDMQDQLTQMAVNFVGNFFIAGPNTDSGEYGVSTEHEGALGAKIFVQGNIGYNRPDESLPEVNVVEPAARRYVVSTRNPAVQVNTSSADAAYTSVLANAGSNRGLNCDGSFFDRRDAIDNRVVGEVQNGSGKIIDNPSQVGGYLTIPAAGACPDADHDGMPNTWESAHGFDPNSSADAYLDQDGDGYSNIEEFLNGTGP
jgi:pectate lyase